MPLRTRMASVGQFLMQVVHPRQRLYSNMTECFIIGRYTSIGFRFSRMGAAHSGPRPSDQILIFMVTVVPTPTVVSMRISSE